MKRFAYMLEDGEYKKTNVWEVARGLKENPHRWENMKYSSTHKKIENRQPMKYIPRTPHKRDFFSYININKDIIREGHETTITHELVQEIVSELKEITFILLNKDNAVYKIYVSDSEVEEEVRTLNGKYYVDVRIKFEKSEPSYLVQRWGGILAVEVYVEHKVQQSKIQDLKSVGMPIIEIEVSEKLRINEDKELTEEDIKRQKEYLKKLFEEKIYARLIGDYTSREYLIACINELKKQVQKLEGEKAQQHKQLLQNKENIETLQSIVNGLRRQLNNKQTELDKATNELNAVKKSFWYKMIKK